MNILFLNSASRGWGGNEKWTLLATNALSKNHNVYLAYRHTQIGNRFSIKKYQLPFIVEVDFITIAKLIAIIKKNHIDVLIPTKRKDYMIAGIACRISGITNILRLGIDRPMKNTFLHKLVYHLMADGIIVNAQKTKKTLHQTPWIQSKKIRVIYNGLDEEELTKNSQPHPIKKYDVLIASAGSLIPRKGFDFLIKAFARSVAQSQGCNAGLIIAGEGSQRQELENIAFTLGIKERVHFEGFLNNPYPMMKECDIFVSTSQSEGISNALLESMFLQCLPISTYSGGADEILENGVNGFLISYGDEEKLANLLSDLYQNPERRHKIAVAAQRTVSKKFSTSLMEKEIVAFCQETCNKKNYQ